MITIVNSNSNHFKNLSVNIPTQKTIAICGNLNAANSILFDTIHAESCYRFEHIFNVTDFQQSTKSPPTNTQFISGLQASVCLNRKNNLTSALFERLQTFLQQKVRGITFLCNLSSTIDNNTAFELYENLIKLKNYGNSVLFSCNHPYLISNAEVIIFINNNGEVQYQGDPESVPKNIGEILKLQNISNPNLTLDGSVFDIYKPIRFNLNDDEKLEFPFNKITSLNAEVNESNNIKSLFGQLSNITLEIIFPSTNANLNHKHTNHSNPIPLIYLNQDYVENKTFKTIAEATQLKLLIENIYTIAGSYNLFGFDKNEISNTSILILLQEFRKNVVLPKSFSEKEPIQRQAQIISGAIINRLDILEKLGFGNYTLLSDSSKLKKGEIVRLKLAALIALDLSFICVVIDQPMLDLNENNLDNLFFMLYELKRQGNTIIALESEKAFLNYSDKVLQI